jgi:aspartate--ammonia ligase
MPDNYEPILNLKETAAFIKITNDYLETNFARELNLMSVPSPSFTLLENDKCNNSINKKKEPILEKEEKNKIKHCDNEIISWKKNALNRYGFETENGLYTRLTCEENIAQSKIYYSVLSWEKKIKKNDKNLHLIKYIAKKIFKILKMAEKYIYQINSKLTFQLLDEMDFMTLQEIEEKFPNITLENAIIKITKKKKIVCIIENEPINNSKKINKNNSLQKHCCEINGYIFLYYSITNQFHKISNIKVSANNCENTVIKNQKNTHSKSIFQTIGGNINITKILIFFLKKIHVGEIQSLIWPEKFAKLSNDYNIMLP